MFQELDDYDLVVWYVAPAVLAQGIVLLISLARLFAQNWKTALAQHNLVIVREDL